MATEPLKAKAPAIKLDKHGKVCACDAGSTKPVGDRPSAPKKPPVPKND